MTLLNYRYYIFTVPILLMHLCVAAFSPKREQNLLAAQILGDPCFLNAFISQNAQNVNFIIFYFSKIHTIRSTAHFTSILLNCNGRRATLDTIF